MRGSAATAHRPPTRRRRAVGFSLLEMLVAAVVLAVGLVIVTESISAGLTAATRTERRLVAGRLAADRLNRTAADDPAVLDQQGHSRFAGVEYRWRVRAARPRQGLRRLLCTVRWTTRGRQRTLTLERFVPPRPQEGATP